MNSNEFRSGGIETFETQQPLFAVHYSIHSNRIILTSYLFGACRSNRLSRRRVGIKVKLSERVMIITWLENGIYGNVNASSYQFLEVDSRPGLKACPMRVQRPAVSKRLRGEIQERKERTREFFACSVKAPCSSRSAVRARSNAWVVAQRCRSCIAFCKKKIVLEDEAKRAGSILTFFYKLSGPILNVRDSLKFGLPLASILSAFKNRRTRPLGI